MLIFERLTLFIYLNPFAIRIILSDFLLLCPFLNWYFCFNNYFSFLALSCLLFTPFLIYALVILAFLSFYSQVLVLFSFL